MCPKGQSVGITVNWMKAINICMKILLPLIHQISRYSIDLLLEGREEKSGVSVTSFESVFAWETDVSTVNICSDTSVWVTLLTPCRHGQMEHSEGSLLHTFWATSTFAHPWAPPHSSHLHHIASWHTLPQPINCHLLNVLSVRHYRTAHLHLQHFCGWCLDSPIKLSEQKNVYKIVPSIKLTSSSPTLCNLQCVLPVGSTSLIRLFPWWSTSCQDFGPIFYLIIRFTLNHIFIFHPLIFYLF